MRRARQTKRLKRLDEVKPWLTSALTNASTWRKEGKKERRRKKTKGLPLLNYNLVFVEVVHLCCCRWIHGPSKLLTDYFLSGETSRNSSCRENLSKTKTCLKYREKNERLLRSIIAHFAGFRHSLQQTVLFWLNAWFCATSVLAETLAIYLNYCMVCWAEMDKSKTDLNVSLVAASINSIGIGRHCKFV